MSKVIQTVEELEAVLHWRRKHAEVARALDAAKAREDALQQRLTAADERADELVDLLTHAHIAIHTMEPGFFLLKKIDAALKPEDTGKPSTCTWTEGGFSWHTGCRKEWQFTDGGLPSENGMHFCHSCGKTLVVESAESA